MRGAGGGAGPLRGGAKEGYIPVWVTPSFHQH